jgi:hypothetical protein
LPITQIKQGNINMNNEPKNDLNNNENDLESFRAQGELESRDEIKHYDDFPSPIQDKLKQTWAEQQQRNIDINPNSTIEQRREIITAESGIDAMVEEVKRRTIEDEKLKAPNALAEKIEIQGQLAAELFRLELDQEKAVDRARDNSIVDADIEETRRKIDELKKARENIPQTPPENAETTADQDPDGINVQAPPENAE